MLNFYAAPNVPGVCNGNDSTVGLKLDVFLCWTIFSLSFYFFLQRKAHLPLRLGFLVN